MILDIDHIAICTTQFEQSIDMLKNLGYRPHFIQKNITNPKIKKPFLTQFSDKHDLALLDCKNNLSIELINYGYSTSEQTPFALTCDEAPIKDLSVLQHPSNTISLNVKSIEESIEFWKTFGFKVTQQTPQTATLQFSSFFKKCSYHLALKKNQETNNSFFLDGQGFNSIAFITTSVKKERENLIKKNIFITKVESLFLNNKKLNIFFAKGPNGIFIEFIEVTQNKG